MTQPLRMLNTWDTTTLQRQYFHFFQMNLFDNIVLFSQLCYRVDRPKVMHKVGQCVPGENEQFFLSSLSKLDFFVVIQYGSLLCHPIWDFCCCHPIWDLNVVLLKFNLFLKGDSHGWKGLKSCKGLRNEIEVMNYFASKDQCSSNIKWQSPYRKVQSAIFHQPYRIQKQLNTHTGSHVIG